ncbi:D-alanyl-D-alanine carboxypeptidase family protein [Evtepia sp.]|uniref:D-alanyl-D-alanine carboxypeptidase family protein n=1 Tax=Evtepia sp. TaxID=2773933 RepID=UPI003F15686F
MGRKLIALAALCVLWPGLLIHTMAAEAPAVSAASAVLLDADSGRILYAQNENEERAIASITKLMTALVAAEYLDDLSQTITIQKEWTGIEGTSLYLKAGEEISLETLLYGLLLHSGNDAAVALAAHCAGDVETFVGWMNQRARDLGMTGTHFSDPNGLGDEDHYSTALDMARLGAACLKNPVVAKIVATKSIVLEGRSFTNHNKLLWQYEGCTGMKTGYTRQAGRTLVSSAERDGQKLVCVTLSDGNDWADHKALLDYGFETYPRQVLAEEGGTLRRMTVEESLLRQVPVVARDTVAYPLKEGEQVTAKIQLPKTARAPVTQGEIAGTVTFYKGERQVGRTYLVWGKSAGQDVISQDSPRSPLGMLKRWTGEESTA